MIRLVTLKLISNYQTLMVKIENVLISSGNRTRLFARFLGASLIGYIGNLFYVLSYAVLFTIVYFDSIRYYQYPCRSYFDELLTKRIT